MNSATMPPLQSPRERRAATDKQVVLSVKELLALEQGIPIASYVIANGTDENAYATLEITSLLGTYQRRWVTSRVFVKEDDDLDTCLDDDPPCTTGNPRATPVIDEFGPSHPEPLPDPAQFLALRVLDRQTGIAEICVECDPNEFLILGRHQYEVQVVMSSLAFLVPDSVDSSLIAPIRIGPEPDPVRIPAGIYEGKLMRCTKAIDPPVCSEHREYDLYQALTRARVDIERLTILMRTAPTADLPPRVPAPATSKRDGKPIPNPVVLSGLSWAYELGGDDVPPNEKGE